jgi:hypothetical protein
MVAKYTKSELDKIIEANRPKYFIHQGDTIRIHSVINRMLGDNLENKKLEHDHDAIAKEVTLEILRENGDLEIVESPIYPQWEPCAYLTRFGIYRLRDEHTLANGFIFQNGRH